MRVPSSLWVISGRKFLQEPDWSSSSGPVLQVESPHCCEFGEDLRVKREIGHVPKRPRMREKELQRGVKRDLR